jgi:UDP-2,3-diacylglucosamine hydrolase
VRPALFVSDLHLSQRRPALVAAFREFCAGPARGASSLYVLGDLFDTWIGDDQLREPLAESVASSMRAVADAGVPVFLMRGNRDLLLGERFAAAAGAKLLPEQIVADVAGVPTVLLHGDELCTDDQAYQRYRAWSHDRERQRRFLALPYILRAAFIRWLRRTSRRETARKSEAIMDVNAEAVADAFRRHGVRRMIHGHTHRPAHHSLEVDGAACERIVLADWYDRASYLEVDGAGVRAHEWPAGLSNADLHPKH